MYYKKHWLRTWNAKEGFMSLYKSSSLDPIQFEEDTDWKHSKPVDAHAQRPLVPWFTGVQEAHFKANVQRNRWRRALRSATKHRLRNPSHGIVMRDQGIISGHIKVCVCMHVCMHIYIDMIEGHTAIQGISLQIAFAYGLWSYWQILCYLIRGPPKTYYFLDVPLVTKYLGVHPLCSHKRAQKIQWNSIPIYQKVWCVDLIFTSVSRTVGWGRIWISARYPIPSITLLGVSRPHKYITLACIKIFISTPQVYNSSRQHPSQNNFNFVSNKETKTQKVSWCPWDWNCMSAPSDSQDTWYPRKQYGFQ